MKTLIKIVSVLALTASLSGCILPPWVAQVAAAVAVVAAQVVLILAIANHVN